MKHFVKKHTHHFGLWALSGLLLIWSIIWLNNLDKKIEIEPTATSSVKIVSQEIASSSGSLPAGRQARNDNAPSADKQQTKPISANALANDVISSVTPTENQKDTVHSAESDKNEQTISVVFKIIAPSTTKEFTIQTQPQSAVYDAMIQLSKQIPIKFKKFGAGLGAFVEEIDNWANDSKTNLFWIYYINDQAAKLGISSIKLNPNDIITWRYEQGKF